MRRHTRTAHLLTFGTPLDESRVLFSSWRESSAFFHGLPRVLWEGAFGIRIRFPTLQERARVLWRPFALLPSRALGAARAGRSPRTMRCAVTPTIPTCPRGGRGVEGAMGGGREEGGEEARARERRGGEACFAPAPGGREGKGSLRSLPFPPLPFPGASRLPGQGFPSRPSSPALQRPSFPSGRACALLERALRTLERVLCSLSLHITAHHFVCLQRACLCAPCCLCERALSVSFDLRKEGWKQVRIIRLILLRRDVSRQISRFSEIAESLPI